MLNIRSSGASKPNDTRFRESCREAGENNVQWLNRNVGAAGDNVLVLLLGGRSRQAFRLRVAQSHLRHDLTPSHWSHAALLPEAATLDAGTIVHEIALDPGGGFGFPPPTNAVQEGKLGAYMDAKQFPNIAALKVPVSWKEASAALDRFKRQRAILDGTELLVVWLAFAWGAGRAGNPLLDGHGIPSAAMVEAVISAAGFDLTPSLDSRASCPEAIWQAARWWHEYYEAQKKEALSGAWLTEDCILAGAA